MTKHSSRALIATIVGGGVALAILAGCGKSPTYGAVDVRRMAAADDNAGQWMSHGRTYDEQRYSPLKQINVENVNKLSLAWFADFDTNRGQESTPIVVDGVLYATSAWSKVYAYKAKTGEPLWTYDPKIPGEWGVKACCDVVNRGVAAWNGKIYLGTLHGRLTALDAGTGKVVWETQVTDPDKYQNITGAPRVANGRVFIGEAGSEFHQRGYFSAYDAETGKLLWRWYIVPGNPANGFENKQMELAAKTWSGEWWKTGGGGAPWDAITYDPKTDLVLIGTGNGAPWPADIRSPTQEDNDNLYLSSVVALHAATGEYAWHYQMTPSDSWDYDNTQQIMLADLTIDGKQRHVAMQASKNGFFYVLDAATGELISAKNFVETNWASGIDMKTGRPMINPESRYDRTGKGFILTPGPGGGHSWHPMSFNPQTGLVYIPAMRSNYGMVAAREDDNPMGQKLSISMTKGFALYNELKVHRISEGHLLAWDPVNQKEVWRYSFENSRGGGTLATAGGLVFQGNSKEQAFAAYRADTGERLWSAPAQTGIVAGAVSYEVDGEQYVSVVAGARMGGNYYASNHSRVLTYKLGGGAQLPPVVEPPPQVLNPPAAFGAPQMIAHGEETYQRFCGTCHGTDGQSRGLFPDLRYSGALHSADAFKAIVIDGALSAKGMVSFAKAISTEDADAVRAYLVGRAIEAKNNPQPSFGPPPPAPAQRATPAAQPH